VSEPSYWSGAVCATLVQGVLLAERLEPATFTRPIPPGRSGIGSHLRHEADFVRAFLAGVGAGRIDYDARQRDARFEREPGYAARRLGELADELAGLDLTRAADLERVVLVRTEAPAGCAPEAHWFPSTVGRELAGLVSHTVHHHALIALALCDFGYEPPAEFGVAPSTLAHWRARSA